MYENGHLFSHAEITVTYIILVVVNNELLIYQYLAEACIIYTIMCGLFALLVFGSYVCRFLCKYTMQFEKVLRFFSN